MSRAGGVEDENKDDATHSQDEAIPDKMQMTIGSANEAARDAGWGALCPEGSLRLAAQHNLVAIQQVQAQAEPARP